MKPIVTLTLNPTIDGSSEAETVEPIRKVRTSNERYHPGGGGINVARVIDALGGPSLAVYFAGGATGPVLDALLERAGTRRQRIDIDGDTRISHAVFERSTGCEYRFVPEGPNIAGGEWRRCLDTLEAIDFEWLVLSGSLPRGVPEDFYVLAGEAARTKGAKVVLDTSGPGLCHAVEAGGIALAKPSSREFQSLVGRELADPDAQHDAAMEIVRSGKVELLAVTLGHHGAFLAGAEGVLRVPALEVKAASAVGAGDSFVAAMTLRLAQGADAREAFIHGVAAGTAAVLTPGTELCKREDVDRFAAEVRQRVGTGAEPHRST